MFIALPNIYLDTENLSMRTLLITPQDIDKVVRWIELDAAMDKVIADLTMAFREVGNRYRDMCVQDEFIAEDNLSSFV